MIELPLVYDERMKRLVVLLICIFFRSSNGTLTTCTRSEPCSQVTCPIGGELCEINCSGNSSCINSRIDCSDSNNCLIHCNGGKACENAIIYGDKADNVSMTFDTPGWNSASRNTTVYCPVNPNVKKNCAFDCDSPPDSCRQMNIYAVEGMSDLVFAFQDGSYMQFTVIHCGEDYEYPCLYSMSI